MDMLARKVPYRWRDKDTEVFLKLYRQQECLWNTKIVDYKDKNKRVKAYEALRDNLQIEDLTIYDVKGKIKSIRTAYCSDVKKIAKSQRTAASPDEVYVPTLSWFPLADTFLRDVIIRRKSSPSNVEDESFEASFNTVYQEEGAPVHHIEEVVGQEDPEDPQTEYLQLICAPSDPPQRLSTRSDQMQTVVKLENLASKSSSIFNSNREEDEYDLFCRSLAIQLRKMPELAALELMQQMQALVLSKKQQLQQTSHNHISAEDCACPSSSRFEAEDCEEEKLDPLASKKIKLDCTDGYD